MRSMRISREAYISLPSKNVMLDAGCSDWFLKGLNLYSIRNPDLWLMEEDDTCNDSNGMFEKNIHISFSPLNDPVDLLFLSVMPFHTDPSAYPHRLN